MSRALPRRRARHGCAAIGSICTALESKARKHLAMRAALTPKIGRYLVLRAVAFRRQFLAADRLVNARIDLIVEQRDARERPFVPG